MGTALRSILRSLVRFFTLNIILLGVFIVWSMHKGKDFGYVATWIREIHLPDRLGLPWRKEMPLEADVIKVAVGLGITSRGMRMYPSVHKTIAVTPFFAQLLPSFCDTASEGYQYHFYIGHDINDTFYTNRTMTEPWRQMFHNITQRKCHHHGEVKLHLIKCNHSGRLVWAQNDAMMEAYRDGIHYFYRVNDDTRLVTTNWTTVYINALKQMKPPLLGVVGPNHKGGNTRIMTYDFVHRTHIDIFGYYYPRKFFQWYADNWITEIYKPKRSRKITNIRIFHTRALGSRYKLVMLTPKYVNEVVRTSRIKIRDYLNKTGYKDARN